MNDIFRRAISIMAAIAGLGFASAYADPPALADTIRPRERPVCDVSTVAPVGLALAVFPAKGGKTLKVTSQAFADGGDIPMANTRWGANVFPGLAWGKGPYGTMSFVVIMQDADVTFRGGPLLHWTMYAIPAAVTKLAAGMTDPPPGASYGPNVRGPDQAYMGPHTPAGAKHHYHFAVLALDREIPVDPALTYDALAGDISGHVLASGEVVGLGHAPQNSAAEPRVRLENTFKF
jgi:para-nitrobenzyl esterase